MIGRRAEPDIWIELDPNPGVAIDTVPPSLDQDPEDPVIQRRGSTLVVSVLLTAIVSVGIGAAINNRGKGDSSSAIADAEMPAGIVPTSVCKAVGAVVEETVKFVSNGTQNSDSFPLGTLRDFAQIIDEAVVDHQSGNLGTQADVIAAEAGLRARVLLDDITMEKSDTTIAITAAQLLLSTDELRTSCL